MLFLILRHQAAENLQVVRLAVVEIALSKKIVDDLRGLLQVAFRLDEGQWKDLHQLEVGVAGFDFRGLRGHVRLLSDTCTRSRRVTIHSGFLGRWLSRLGLGRSLSRRLLEAAALFLPRRSRPCSERANLRSSATQLPSDSRSESSTLT